MADLGRNLVAAAAGRTAADGDRVAFVEVVPVVGRVVDDVVVVVVVAVDPVVVGSSPLEEEEVADRTRVVAVAAAELADDTGQVAEAEVAPAVVRTGSGTVDAVVVVVVVVGSVVVVADGELEGGELGRRLLVVVSADDR